MECSIKFKACFTLKQLINKLLSTSSVQFQISWSLYTQFYVNLQVCLLWWTFFYTEVSGLWLDLFLWYGSFTGKVILKMFFPSKKRKIIPIVCKIVWDVKIPLFSTEHMVYQQNWKMSKGCIFKKNIKVDEFVIYSHRWVCLRGCWLSWKWVLLTFFFPQQVTQA